MVQSFYILTVVSLGLFAMLWAYWGACKVTRLFRHRASVDSPSRRRGEGFLSWMTVLLGFALLAGFAAAAWTGSHAPYQNLIPALQGLAGLTLITCLVMGRQRRAVSLVNISGRDFTSEARNYFADRGLDASQEGRIFRVRGMATLNAASFTPLARVRLDPARGTDPVRAEALARDMANYVAARAPKRAGIGQVAATGAAFAVFGFCLVTMAWAASAFEAVLG